MRYLATGWVASKIHEKYPRYAYVLTDGNVRYKELMCASDAKKYTQAYEAARNALAYGVDYSNGGCFWDGVSKDLKIKGERHYRYKVGFRFVSPEHNILGIIPPPARKEQGTFDTYDYMYDSTAAYGDIVFWKVNEQYLKAERAKQCK